MKKNISQEVDGVNRRQFLQLSANIGVLMAVMPDSAFAQGSKDLVVAIPADLGVGIRTISHLTLSVLQCLRTVIRT